MNDDWRLQVDPQGPGHGRGWEDGDKPLTNDENGIKAEREALMAAEREQAEERGYKYVLVGATDEDKTRSRSWAGSAVRPDPGIRLA